MVEIYDLFKNGIILEENNKRIIITLNNNDLCWYFESDDIENFNFSITKQSYDIYLIFDMLFSNMKNCQVYKPNLNYPKDQYELNKHLKEIDSKNKKLYMIQKNSMLFYDDAIFWHSDDNFYNNSNILTISKQDDSYLINFKMKDYHNKVYFNHLGSRYLPFNKLFIDLFNDLVEYSKNDHQIHINEIIYNKQKELKL